MSEQRTPDELICEKLLDWRLIRTDRSSYWQRPGGGEQLLTPSFTTWAEAGLILEALTKKDGWPCVTADERAWSCSVFLTVDGEPAMRAAIGDTGPLAIRAAALEYIRSLS